MQDCRRSLNEAEQREAAIMGNGRKLKEEMQTNLVYNTLPSFLAKRDYVSFG